MSALQCIESRPTEICLVAVPAPSFVSDCRAANEDAERALQSRIRETLACLAPHKHPWHVIIRDHALLRTSSGKLRRPELANCAKAQVEHRS